MCLMINKIQKQNFFSLNLVQQSYFSVEILQINLTLKKFIIYRLSVCKLNWQLWNKFAHLFLDFKGIPPCLQPPPTKEIYI